MMPPAAVAEVTFPVNAETLTSSVKFLAVYVDVASVTPSAGTSSMLLAEILGPTEAYS